MQLGAKGRYYIPTSSVANGQLREQTTVIIQLRESIYLPSRYLLWRQQMLSAWKTNKPHGRLKGVYRVAANPTVPTTLVNNVRTIRRMHRPQEFSVLSLHFSSVVLSQRIRTMQQQRRQPVHWLTGQLCFDVTIDRVHVRKIMKKKIGKISSHCMYSRWTRNGLGKLEGCWATIVRVRWSHLAPNPT